MDRAEGHETDVVEVALSWWHAYGDARLEDLWRLSTRPVRYMLARCVVAHVVNERSARGDRAAADELLIACQDAALHGPSGTGWAVLAPHRGKALRPVPMDDLMHHVRRFPRRVEAVGGYQRVTIFPPDSPPMPWIVDPYRGQVAGFTAVLHDASDAGALAERIAVDPTALWSPAD